MIHRKELNSTQQCLCYLIHKTNDEVFGKCNVGVALARKSFCYGRDQMLHIKSECGQFLLVNTGVFDLALFFYYFSLMNWGFWIQNMSVKWLGKGQTDCIYTGYFTTADCTCRHRWNSDWLAGRERLVLDSMCVFMWNLLCVGRICSHVLGSVLPLKLLFRFIM